MTIFWFVVYALATARLTRLVVADRLTLRWRRWVVARYGEDSLAAYFAFCPWCLSLWISPIAAFGFVSIAFPFGRIWWIALAPVALAYSYLTGLMAKLEGE